MSSNTINNTNFFNKLFTLLYNLFFNKKNNKNNNDVYNIELVFINPIIML